MTPSRKAARGHALAAAPLAGLNAEQRAAVGAPQGPLLVVAGAGSGKTLVLTRRIAALIASGGIAPSEVLAIAFTNRAARELGERVGALLGEGAAAQMTLATFHGAAHRLLVRPYAERLGRSRRFSIFDAADGRALIARAIAGEGVAGLEAGEAQKRIGLQKARLATPAALAAEPGLAAIWRRYERALAACDALDFDDLLLGAVTLSGHADVLARLRKRFRAVLVDEFQDTNPAQYEWIRRLVGAQGNLTATGDEDQAIFGFRLADVRYVLEFEQRFEGARVVTLGRNYRSSGAIVAAAARLIAHNSERRPKDLRTQRPHGPAPALTSHPDEWEEARAAVTWCAARVRGGRSPGELALLYRTRALVRPLEQALLGSRLPYRVLGGQGFFEYAEVRDALAYLALLANPRNKFAFARALQSPRRGLGPAAVGRLIGWAEESGEGNLLAALVAGARVPGLRGEQGETAAALGRSLAELALRARGGKGPLGAVVAECLLASGLPRALQGRRGGAERIERLRELVRVARSHERASDGTDLPGFLAEAALMGGRAEQGSLALTLATIHAAKGLEWGAVRVLGLEEGLLPHHRSLQEGALEEERRLAYVAMTRAKDELALSWARERGERPRIASRFLAEAGVSECGGPPIELARAA